MKKNNPKIAENIEKLERVIEAKKKIPKEVKRNILRKVIENLVFGIVIIIYLGSLSLGNANMPDYIYLIYIKVFSILLLCTTIIMYEVAYRKDETSLWGHATEILFIAIFTSYLISLHTEYLR